MQKTIPYFFCFLVSLSFGQSGKGTLSGKIIDRITNETIPFAQITLTKSDSIYYFTSTNSEGNYFFKNILADTFLVEVSSVGYSSTQFSKIIVAGQNRTSHVVLDPTEISLKEYTISAKKYEHKITDETVSSTVIESEIIKDRITTNPRDIVTQIPGVHAQEEQISIRGGAGFSYGAGSRVLVMLDGIPMLAGDAGDIKWNYLPLEGINQIEVLKGASSVLYGSSALNGVINIRTQYPTSTPKTEINFIAGMYDKPFRGRDLKWWDGYRGMQGTSFFHARQVTKHFDLVVGGNFFNDQSFRIGEKETRGRLNINTKFQHKKIKGLFYGVNSNAQLSDVDLFFVWKEKDSVLTPSPGTNSSGLNNRFNIDPYIEYFAKNGDKHTLKTRWFNTDNNNQVDPTQSSTSNLYFGEYQFKKNIDTNYTLTSGATIIKTFVNSTLYGNHESTNLAAYTQLDKVMWKKLTFSAGLRAEYYQLNAVNEPIIPIARMGLNYHMAKATFIRASIGQGYRFPSVAEKFASTSLGTLSVFPNPELTPEKGWSAEIGIKQGIKIKNWKGYIDIAGFINEYENMTEYTFGFFDTTTFEQKPSGSINEFGASSRNVNKARISGIDLTLAGKGKIGKVGIQLLAGYTFMNPKPIDADSAYLSTFSSLTTNYTYDRNLDLNSDSVSDNLKYRFNHLFKVDVQLEYKKLNVGGSYRFNSFIHNIDESFHILGIFSGNTFLGGLEEYRRDQPKNTQIIDVRIGYKHSSKIKLSFVCNNLLNTEYQTRPGWVMPPRNFVFQSTFSF